MRKTALALAAVAGLALAGPAAAEPYLLDKSHAHVSFEVSHLGFSLTQGWFRVFDAEVDLDPENVEAAKVRFVIQADSVDTMWDARDKHIRSKDFLDVANHPEIVFVSTGVTKTGDETAEVTGELTIRGETREVTFEARLNKLGPSPFDPAKTVAGFTVSGEIDRTAFGINYAAPAVGAVVPIEVQMELSPAG